MRIPKICLIMPPGSKTGFPYVGLAYIQSYMKHRFGKNISIKTLDLSRKSFSDIHQILSNERPDLLGISCMTFTRSESFCIAKIAKEINRNTITVFGGHHCQYLWEQVLTHYPQVDYIVHGEGELIFGDLVQTLFFGDMQNLIKVKGISFRMDNSPVFNGPAQAVSDIDILPPPDYEDFEMSRYRDDEWIAMEFKSQIALQVYSSRGCPHMCYFCCDGQSRRIWRSRAIEKVIEEIIYYMERYNTNYFHLSDDTFTVNRRRVLDFCASLIDSNLNLKWDIRARSENLDKEILSALKKAGCLRINIGIESGSQKILKNMNKKQDIEKAIDVIHMARDMGLIITINILIGYPGEDDSTIDETLRFIRKARPHGIASNILMVFPGAEVYNYAKSIGYMNDAMWLDESMKIFYYTRENDYLKLKRYVQKCYITHYRTVGLLTAIRDIRNKVAWQIRQNPRYFFESTVPWIFKRQN